MARSPRLFIPDSIYHVYCRTARGEMVFSDPEEANEFIEISSDVKRLHGFDVLAWCLMGNHYHLVIRTRTIPLWRSMARIQSRVARGHNRRRRILGRLWQSRYKATSSLMTSITGNFSPMYTSILLQQGSSRIRRRTRGAVTQH